MSQQHPVVPTSKVFIFMKLDYDWENGGLRRFWRPDFWSTKVEEEPDRVFLCEQEITVDVSTFNPLPQQLAALEKEKQKATEAFVKRTAELNEQISKLLAIEHTPEAEPLTPDDDIPF